MVCVWMACLGGGVGGGVGGGEQRRVLSSTRARVLVSERESALVR